MDRAEATATARPAVARARAAAARVTAAAGWAAACGGDGRTGAREGDSGCGDGGGGSGSGDGGAHTGLGAWVSFTIGANPANPGPTRALQPGPSRQGSLESCDYKKPTRACTQCGLLLGCILLSFMLELVRLSPSSLSSIAILALSCQTEGAVDVRSVHCSAGGRRARRERARGGWRASSTCVVVERERVCLYNATRGETTMRREGKLAVGGPKLAGWGSPATPIPQVFDYCPHPASLTGGVLHNHSSRYAPNVRTQRTHPTYATNVRTQNSTLGKCPFPVYKTRIRKPSKSGTRTAHSASSSLITASASCA